MLNYSILPPDRQAFSIRETGRILGLGRTTVYLLIKLGMLRSRKILGRTVIMRADLEEYLSRL